MSTDWNLTGAEPVDIHLRVTRSGDTLELTMVSAALGFASLDGKSAALPRDPGSFADQFFHAAESLDGGHVGGDRLLGDEAVDELRDRCRNLYRQIFPADFRARLDARETTDCSLIVETDEPWIPWEMLHTDGPDGDFFCLRFNMARWLPGQASSPTAQWAVSRILCVDGGQLLRTDVKSLPDATRETQALVDLAATFSGLWCDVVARPPTFATTQAAVLRIQPQILHLSGHGELDANTASFVLNDRPLYPWNLTPSKEPDLLAVLRATRPLIFLNACRVGRRREGFVGFSGWPDTLIGAEACGGFLAPALPVQDRFAAAFSDHFYRALSRGRTLGEAVRAARLEATAPDGNRSMATSELGSIGPVGDLTETEDESGLIETLSYVLYGHPNAEIELGSARRPRQPDRSRPPIRRLKVALSAASHDRAAARMVASRLTSSGIEVASDSRRLQDVTWPEALDRRLSTCDALVVLVGPRGLSSWQLREVQLATSPSMARAIRVVVVLLPGAEAPLSLLACPHWVDLRSDLDDAGQLRLLELSIGHGELGDAARGLQTSIRRSLSPYRGLLALRQDDAAVYFGRDDEIDRLEAALDRSAFVTVSGASGSGKSSLVHAGLAPRLRRSVQPTWEIVTLQPREEPLESLAFVGWQLLESDNAHDEIDRADWLERCVERLADTPARFAKYVQRALKKHPGIDHLLLIIDQADDLFTTVDAETRRLFLEAVQSATRDAPLRVVLTLRAELTGQALEDPILGPHVARETVLLQSMDAAALIETIRGPAGVAGITIDPHLGERIVDDIRDQPGNLPLLGFALAELWRVGGGSRLRTIDYDGFGGIENVIAERAEAIYRDLSEAEAADLRAVFLELVRPGEAADTRRRVSSKKIPAAARPIVDRLVAARLLTTSSATRTADERAVEGTVEVAHEALITRWTRLRTWVDEDREFLLWRERLKAAETRWTLSGRGNALLWSRGDLAEATRWMTERAGLAQDEFLTRSLAAQRTKRWAVRMTAGLIAFLALMAAYWGARSLQVAKAIREQAEMTRSQALLTSAANQPDPAIAARILTHLGEDHPLGRSVDAVQTAFNVAQRFGARKRIRFDGRAGAISDDGKRLALSQVDGTIQIRDTAQLASVAELRGHDGRILQVDLSSTGQRAASVASGGNLRIWDVDATRAITSMDLSATPPQRLTISHDGRFFAFTSGDSVIRVGNATETPEIVQLVGHSDWVETLEFSPTGDRIVTASRDGTVRVWDRESGHELRVFPMNGPEAAAFSNDGHHVLGNAFDRVRIWDLAQPDTLPPIDLRVDSDLYTAMMPGRTHDWVLAATTDGFVRLWNLQQSALIPGTVSLQTNDISCLDLSEDQHLVVAGANDGSLWVSRILAGRSRASQLVGHSRAVHVVRFVNGDKNVLSISSDGTARLWDVGGIEDPYGYQFRKDSPAILLATQIHRGLDTTTLSLSRQGQLRFWSAPDRFASFNAHGEPIRVAEAIDGGRKVLSISGRSTVFLWDFEPYDEAIRRALTEPRSPRQADLFEPALRLDESGVEITAATLSPTGLAALGRRDGTVDVLDPERSNPSRRLGAHAKPVVSVAFDHSGSRVVSSARDGSIKIWTTDGDGAAIDLAAHHGPATRARFSHDGQRVVSAGQDGLVRVHPLDDLESPIDLPGHTRGVLEVRFSDDDERVASASSDGSIRVWNPDRSWRPMVLRGHTGPVTHLAFTREPDALISGSVDGTVRVWDLDGVRAPSILIRHVDSIRSLSVDPEHRTVLSTSDDGAIRAQRLDDDSPPEIFFHPDVRGTPSEYQDSTRLTTVLSSKLQLTPAGATPSEASHPRLDPRVPLGPMTSVAFCADARRVVTGSADAEVVVWTVGTGERFVLRGHTGPIVGVACASERVVSFAADGTIRLWNEDHHPVVLAGHTHRVLTAGFMSDGVRIASASVDGTIRIWSADTGTSERVMREPTGYVIRAAFEPRSSQMALGLSDGTIEIWRLSEPHQPPTILSAHSAPVLDLELSDNGERLVSASKDGTVRVWSLSPEAVPLRSFATHESWLHDARFNADASRVAYIGSGNRLFVAATTGDAEPLQLVEHARHIMSLAWTADGSRILSSSADTTIRVSDASGEGEPLVLEGHAREVTRAVFSHDGRQIASVAQDGTTRVWSVAWDAILETLEDTTRFCLTPRERRRYLSESAADAHRNFEACTSQ